MCSYFFWASPDTSRKSGPEQCYEYSIRCSTRVTVSKVLSLLSHGRGCPLQLLRWGWLCPAKSAQPVSSLTLKHPIATVLQISTVRSVQSARAAQAAQAFVEEACSEEASPTCGIGQECVQNVFISDWRGKRKKRMTKIDQIIPLSSSSAKQRRLTARKKALKNAS